MSSVQVRLFGAFREAGHGAVLEIGLSAPCTLSVFKELLSAQLDPELLSESALGTDTELLGPDAMIRPGQTIAVLPPVCGG